MRANLLRPIAFLVSVVVMLGVAEEAKANWIKKAMRGGTGVQSGKPEQPKSVTRPAPAPTKPVAQKPAPQPQPQPPQTTPTTPKQDGTLQNAQTDKAAPARPSGEASAQ
jgi:hypothetical protein